MAAGQAAVYTLPALLALGVRPATWPVHRLHPAVHIEVCLRWRPPLVERRPLGSLSLQLSGHFLLGAGALTLLEHKQHVAGNCGLRLIYCVVGTNI